MSGLAWDRKAMCVTCGTASQTIRYHRGHVISRALMKAPLIWLNRIARANNEPEFRDDASWNIVCQCRDCNNSTYDRIAQINHPSNERQALWKALALHNAIYQKLHRGVASLALQAVYEAGCKKEGVQIDEVEKTALVESAVDLAIEAIDLISGANDIALLRQWHAKSGGPL